MRDDASLRRLAEIGIDVYVPRGARTRVGEAAAISSASRREPRLHFVLLTRVGDVRHALVADVRRALAFARVDAAIESTMDDGRIGDAAGIIVFGEALARDAGVAFSAQRQRALAWVATGEPAALGGNVPAKRNLWSELKRVVRGLDSGPQRP